MQTFGALARAIRAQGALKVTTEKTSCIEPEGRVGEQDKQIEFQAI